VSVDTVLIVHGVVTAGIVVAPSPAMLIIHVLVASAITPVLQPKSRGQVIVALHMSGNMMAQQNRTGTS
jgi:hypothetical protein